MKYGTVLLFLLVGCTTKPIKIESKLSYDSIQEISTAWKHDSTGCQRIRDANRIKQLIYQLDLIGQDSTILIKHLGAPNKINSVTNKKVFLYYLGCNDSSSYNFYCNFEGKTLISVQTAIIN
jgi:hypothetical protein